MNRKLSVCAWCGIATLVFASIGFLVAGLLPVPLSPNASATKVASFYGDDPTRVKLGFIIAFLALPLVIPLVAAITVRMLRIEGRTPILSFVQLVAGCATSIFLTVPVMLMAICAFRPDRDPHLTQTLNDIAWLLFITPIAPFIIQNVAIGTAVLSDHREVPVLPRWVGYANFLIGFLFLPDVLCFFFRNVLFGWNGIFIFWLAFTAYAAWLVIMSVVLLRADRAPAAAATAASAARVAEPATL